MTPSLSNPAKSTASARNRRTLRWIFAIVILSVFLLVQPYHRTNSPVVLPERTEKKPATADSRYLKKLREQLRRVRDNENWRLLGDPRVLGEHLYEEFASAQVQEANIAFFIQISTSNLLLVPRLLSRIWHPQNIYCLHIDEKTPAEYVEEFVAALNENSKLRNTFVMPASSVTYAGISMLLNTLDSMHALLKPTISWDYFINLSGSDYPLVSVTSMRKLLGLAQRPKQAINYIHFSPDTKTWTKLALHRLGRLHFDHALGFRPKSTAVLHETQYVNPLLTAGNIRVEIGKGEAWIIAHRSFCELAAHGSVGRRLLALFANMQSAPEHFFQTLGWNHLAVNETVARHSFREIVWNRDGVRSGQHPYYVDSIDADGSWPFWAKLAHSPNFFARKFRVVDSALMDHIDFTKSGATDGIFNISSIAESFRIVKNRFACVSDLRKRRGESHIMSCLWSGWMKRECRKGVISMCVGEFPAPPLANKLQRLVNTSIQRY